MHTSTPEVQALDELQKVAFNPVSHNYALKCGALLVLLNKLSTSNGSILRKLTSTISKFCGGLIQPSFSKVLSTIKPLCELVNINDNKVVLSNACKALCLIFSVSDSSNSASVLCDYVGNDDKGWVDVGLKGIEKILKLGEAKKASSGDNNVYIQKIKEDESWKILGLLDLAYKLRQ
ncbi:hypothetical protein CQW23_26584 [Capsicum baccatum]|uniref:Uncharacterized protein n=1 Tax=Capsicum baccatum TaxID=33114 RepID=A0A2G2VP78_CAPBA|nr:hypothetical protein CQW23_26584 [Capsicum baccatum]